MTSPDDNDRPYEVIYAKNVFELMESVNEYIRKGYTPCGGFVDGQAAFYQAVYRPPQPGR